MKLDKVFCVDALPTTGGSYSESVDLLFYTVYGSYVLGTFCTNFQGINMFYPCFESRPYSVKEVVYYVELPMDGGLGKSLATCLSER